MAAKKKGPGKGRGPSSRPASPAKRTTVPKPPAPKATAPQPPAAGTPTGAPKPPATTPKPPATTPKPPATTPKPPATAPRRPGTTPPSATPAKPAAASPSGGTKPASGAKPSAAPKPGSAKPAATPKSSSAKPAAAGRSAAAAKAAGAAAGKSTGTPKAGGSSKSATPGKGGTRTTPTREERLAAEAARRRQRLRNRALVAGGVAFVVFVVGFVIISDRRERSRQAAEFTTASCRFDRSTDGDDGPGRNHTATPTYRVNPPAGGNHTVQAAPAGIYTDANLPADGQIVHAMEHGYVVLWYRPDLDESNANALRAAAQKYQPNVLLVPRVSLPTPVAATAWHAWLQCDAFEMETVERFISTFLDKGPEKGHITDKGPAG